MQASKSGVNNILQKLFKNAYYVLKVEKLKKLVALQCMRIIYFIFDAVYDNSP